MPGDRTDRVELFEVRNYVNCFNPSTGERATLGGSVCPSGWIQEPRIKVQVIGHDARCFICVLTLVALVAMIVSE